MPRVCWEEQLCVSCEFVTINSRCTDFLRSTGRLAYVPAHSWNDASRNGRTSTIRDYLRHRNLHVTNKYLQATSKTKRLAHDTNQESPEEPWQFGTLQFPRTTIVLPNGENPSSKTAESDHRPSGDSSGGNSGLYTLPNRVVSAVMTDRTVNATSRPVTSLAKSLR
jgi:hypothetical protein